MRTADVIVVGLGAMGSAASWQLASRGVSVIGIDRYAPPHAWGSTHGDTRITRLAIGEGREYVPLARRSHELWREIEGESGAELLTQPGIVILAHPSSTFLAETRAAALEYGIDHRDLTNAELRAGFPMFAVDERTVGYHEPEAGYVRPERAVAAQLALAVRDGAQLRLGERVERWAASPDGVTVTTDRDTYAARQLLLCAGAWIGDLVAAGARHRRGLPPAALLVSDPRELRRAARHAGVRMGRRRRPAGLRAPGWLLRVPRHRRPRRRRQGRRGVLRAHDDVRTDASTRPIAAEIERMYHGCVEPYLPWLGAEPLRTVSCLYTSTRGARFIIDRHPEHDAVMVVSACSGHGFKHSPAIGEAVAQWLTGASPRIDLSPFSFERAQRA